MRQVSDLLLIGDAADAGGGLRRPLLSACQTFHYRRHGWTPKNRPTPGDPGYLWKDDDGWLTLNWVDGPASLYEHGGAQPWLAAFRFLDRQTARDVPTVIHCDRGRSRAPTLTLAYLSHTRQLPLNPDEAAEAFLAVYPDWCPGGIWDWLQQNWHVVLS